jgi:DNA-binding transcriptional LysR family regulator
MTGFPKDDLTTPVARQRSDWSDLRVFWAVAEAGAFGAAARKLGITASALTKRVDALETRLGAKLLIRGPLGVSLTEAGEQVFDHVVTMEREAAKIERLVRDSDRKEEGLVRLAAPDGVAGFNLAHRLPEFFEANPMIRLWIDCDFDTAAPASRAPDISLMFDEAAEPEYITELVAHVHYCLFASRSYLETYGLPTTMGEAASHRYIHHAGQRRQQNAWRDDVEPFQKLARNAIITNSSTVSLLAAQAGAGIALLPSRAIVRAPELVVLDPAPAASVKLWMRSHRQSARNGRIRRVLQWVREVFDAKENPWFRPEFIHPEAFRPSGTAEPANATPPLVTPRVHRRAS